MAVWMHNVLSRIQRSTHIPEVGDLFEIRNLTYDKYGYPDNRLGGLYIYLGWRNRFKPEAAIETYSSRETRRREARSWCHRVWNVNTEGIEYWGISQFERGYYLVSNIRDSIELSEDGSDG